MQKVPASQVIGISFNIFRRHLPDRLLLLRQQLHLELFHNGVGDFVLNSEDVGQVAIKTLGPDMTAVLAANELSSYPHARSGFPHASLQDKSNAKLLTDLLHFYGLVFVGKGGVARDNEQAGDLGQVSDDVLRDAIAKILLLRVAAHVVKRQNGNRRSFLLHGYRILIDCVLQCDAVNTNGPRNALQSRRNVDAVAEDVVPFHDHIAQVHPNTEFDSAILRQVDIAIAHCALNLSRAPDRVYHAGEFHQHTVTGQLHNAPLLLRNPAIHKIGPHGFERFERPGFVLAHKSAVADHVGGKDGTQTTFHVSPKQRILPTNRKTNQLVW